MKTAVNNTADAPTRPWTLLLSILRLERKACAVVLMLLLVGIGVQLGLPQVLARFLDGAAGAEPLDDLLTLAIIYVGMAVLGQGVTVLRTYLAAQIAWRGSNRIRRLLATHCLSLDLAFHKRHTPGELLERVEGDVAALSNLLSEFFLRVAGYILLLTGILVLLFSIHWMIGASGAVFGVVLFASLRAIQPHASRRWTQARQSRAELSSVFEETLTATEDIRSSGAQVYVHHRLGRALTRLLTGYKGALFADNTTFITATGLFFTAYAVALGISAYLFLSGQISIGTVYLVHHYHTIMYGPLQEVQDQLRDLQQAYASLARIAGLLSTQSAIPDRGTSLSPKGALAVQFDDVTFAYGGDDHPIALDRVSFQLQPGRRLGIIGRTGSGKTTLARVLCRLEDAQGGTIRLSGTDAKQIPIDQLRQRVAYVTQDVQLFEGTLLDNITMFDASVPIDLVADILDRLGLASWLSELPSGLQTALGSGGGNLSAGEAQLIGLARVFLRDPGLVILDEASARLDPSTEKRVLKATGELLAGRTGIVIAHRLNTLDQMDQILILSEGAVSECGERQTLAGDPASRFSQLLRVGERPDVDIDTSECLA